MAMERCLLNMVWKRLGNSDIRLFVLKETSDFTKSADLIDYAYKKNISYHDFPKDKLCDFLMLKELQSGALDGISGEYRTPEIYFCAMQNKEDFEEFEKTFPYKEKLKLPSQLF